MSALTNDERNTILRDSINTFFSATASSVSQQIFAAVNHACRATEDAILAKQAKPVITPEWVMLTDDEIQTVADPFGFFKFGDSQGDVRLNFGRAIEAAFIDKQGGAA